MPIPIALIGIGVATATIGVGKGLKAGIDNSDANDINMSAKSVINSAKGVIEHAREKSGSGLESLGVKKLFVLNGSIARFISAFEKLKNVEMEDSAGLDELKNFKIDRQTFSELKEMRNFAASIVGGLVSGSLGGAMTAFGAYGAASLFATASSGTAIATLSGAAATNATLAFFGGGALSVGGLGMAGGAVVLGGLIVGPALAVLGFVMGAKASANLDKAYSNLAEAQKIAEELRTGAVACDAIRRRAFLFVRLLIRLECIFMPLVLRMEEIIHEKGEDYTAFDAEEKRTVAAAVSLAVAVKSVLDTPILTESGALTDESEETAESVKQFVDTKDQPDSVVNDVVFCSNCGKKHSAEVVFCTECGKKLKKIF
jgi:hypothetical protein